MQGKVQGLDIGGWLLSGQSLKFFKDTESLAKIKKRVNQSALQVKQQ